MKKKTLLSLTYLAFGGLAYSQTVYDWKSDAPDANWTQGAGGARWWDNTNSSDLWDIPPSGGILRFNNDAQLTMTNNAGTYNAYGLIFGSSSTSVRTLGGNSVRFYDYGGADAYIQNESSATHVINLNVEGDGDAGDPLNINLNGTGGLTFGGTINNQGSWINVGGTTASAATVTFGGIVSGTGGLYKSNANTTLLLTAVNTYSGDTTINAGTVEIGGAGQLNSGTYAGSISNSGILKFNSTANQTLSGTFSGAGSLVKSNTGTLTLSTQKTYTGGTTVNGGILDLTGGGGGSGTIRGTVTVNTGGTLRLSTGDATGYNTGSDRLATINLVGGTLNVNTASNQTLGNATINMTGGAITGVANSNIDFFQGSSALNTLASATTSTISGTKIQIRQTGGVTFTVASGTTGSGIDLDVSSVISSNSGFTTAPFIKAGLGTMRLSSASTFSGPTNVNGGKLIISGTLLSTSALTVASGATLELGATNIFVGGHGVAMGNTRTITVNGGTLLMNTSMDARFGNVTLNNGATWTSNRALTNYDALLANTDAGAATVSVTGTGAATMNGSGGIHLQGVQNFNVADVTSSSATDLTVSMILGAQGSIGGAAGGINKTGAGTMLLNNTGNAFTGDLTVGAGTIITGTSQGGGSTGYLGAVTGGRTITISSGATLDFRANNQFGGGGKTAATLPSIVVNGGTLTSTRFNILGNVTLNGGTLTQSVTDSGNYEGYEFLGTVTVGGGSASTISSGNGKANHLRGGSTITFNVADATASSASDLVVSNILRNGSGDYTGTGSLLKTGTGTMQMNAVNTYTGTTTVSQGTLVLAAGGDLGTIGSSAIVVESGANLVLSTGDATGYTSGAGLTIRGTMTKATGNFHDTLNRDTILDGGTIAATDGNTTSGGAINLFGNSITTVAGTTSNINITGSTLQLRTEGSTAPTFNVVSNSTLNVNAVVDGYLGTETTPLNKSGGGTMVLSQVNKYDGPTNINGGILRISGSGSLNEGSYAGAISIASGASLDYASSADQVLSGPISGDGTITRSGSGTLTLTGASTGYAGDLAVTAGSLFVNGDLGSATADVTVGSGVMVGGTGSIGGNLILDGASTLTIVDTNDALSVGGTISFSSTGFGISSLSGIDWNTIDAGEYTLLAGTLNPANLGNFGIGQKVTVAPAKEAYFENGSLKLVVIPETSTILLGSLGALALLRRRR
ncbi:MAG: autotransporter-associated beta strand repeat-containing protein [Verrucomicrobia bacterium]|nr:autotransporter-associated beta strand repeat-containing protein [Verrucomicrobiota bacterium]